MKPRSSWYWVEFVAAHDTYWFAKLFTRNSWNVLHDLLPFGGKQASFSIKVLSMNLLFLKGTICRGEDERCCSGEEDFWSAAEKCWSVRSFLFKKKNNNKKKPTQKASQAFACQFYYWILNSVHSIFLRMVLQAKLRYFWHNPYKSCVSLLWYHKGLWSILLKLPS